MKYLKCEKCLAHYPEGNEHVCDTLMKTLVDFHKGRRRENCHELIKTDNKKKGIVPKSDYPLK